MNSNCCCTRQWQFFCFQDSLLFMSLDLQCARLILLCTKYCSLLRLNGIQKRNALIHSAKKWQNFIPLKNNGLQLILPQKKTKTLVTIILPSNTPKWNSSYATPQLPVADLNSKVWVAPRARSDFLYFHAVFSKFWQNTFPSRKSWIRHWRIFKFILAQGNYLSSNSS